MTTTSELTVNTGMQVVHGFLFGIGLILAAVLMKALVQVGFCG